MRRSPFPARYNIQYINITVVSGNFWSTAPGKITFQTCYNNISVSYYCHSVLEYVLYRGLISITTVVPVACRSRPSSSHFFYVSKCIWEIDVLPAQPSPLRRFLRYTSKRPSSFLLRWHASRAISNLRTLALIGRRVSVPVSPGFAVTNSFALELRVDPAFCTESVNPQLGCPVDPV